MNPTFLIQLYGSVDRDLHSWMAACLEETQIRMPNGREIMVIPELLKRRILCKGTIASGWEMTLWT